MRERDEEERLQLQLVAAVDRLQVEKVNLQWLQQAQFEGEERKEW